MSDLPSYDFDSEDKNDEVRLTNENAREVSTIINTMM